MLTRLSEATRTDSGGKAAMLGALLREGLPVPDGFVIPTGGTPTGAEIGRSRRDAVARELGRLGDPVVAVRSSATNEDTEDASAAGQYESILGVRGIDDVCQAIMACRESASAARVGDYWRRTGGASRAPDMAVLVQQWSRPRSQGCCSHLSKLASRPGSKRHGVWDWQWWAERSPPTPTRSHRTELSDVRSEPNRLASI